MPFHLYRVCREGEEPRNIGVRLNYDDDHWVSECREVDEEGEETVEGSFTTPRFYGVTADQALRRVVEVLENTFDEVTPATQETSP